MARRDINLVGKIVKTKNYPGLWFVEELHRHCKFDSYLLSTFPWTDVIGHMMELPGKYLTVHPLSAYYEALEKAKETSQTARRLDTLDKDLLSWELFEDDSPEGLETIEKTLDDLRVERDVEVLKSMKSKDRRKCLNYWALEDLSRHSARTIVEYSKSKDKVDE